jgi:hypothetical protein
MIYKIENIMRETLTRQKLEDFDYGVTKKNYPKANRKPARRKKRRVYSSAKKRSAQYN